MGLFRFLKYGLSAVLVFVGLKMCVSGIWHVPVGLSLGVVGGILAVSIIASLVLPDPKSRNNSA
jgi:tellurite resistance protein TerC